MTQQRFSGTAILAGVVTATLAALVLNVGLGVMRGDWSPGPGGTFAGVAAARGLDLTIVALSAMLVSIVFLTPIFVATAWLGLWKVSHTVNAGLIGGTFLFGVAVVRLPGISGPLLVQMAFVQFSMALAASFAFRQVSLRNQTA